MKKILAAIAFVVVALPVSAFAKETTASMKYTGWHCAGCSSKVEAAVKKVDGVKKVNVSKDTVKVTYDDAKTNPDALKGAIASAGEFKVEDAAAKTDAPKTEAPKADAPKTTDAPKTQEAPK
jgi:copper chaperone CopZ